MAAIDPNAYTGTRQSGARRGFTTIIEQGAHHGDLDDESVVAEVSRPS